MKGSSVYVSVSGVALLRTNPGLGLSSWLMIFCALSFSRRLNQDGIESELVGFSSGCD